MRLAALALACSIPLSVLAADPHELFLTGEVDESMASMVRDEVKKARDDKATEVVVYVNSPGGDILAGWQIIGELRRAKIPTRCVVEGVAASMAAIIVQACDKRQAQPYAVMMFHGGSTMALGKQKDIEDAVTRMKTLNRALAVLVSRRLGMSVEAYEARCVQGDWWLTADVAKAAGAVDEVLP